MSIKTTGAIEDPKHVDPFLCEPVMADLQTGITYNDTIDLLLEKRLEECHQNLKEHIHQASVKSYCFLQIFICNKITSILTYVWYGAGQPEPALAANLTQNF